VTLTAHLTPGHTPGCTTWTMTVPDGAGRQRIVFVGGWSVNPGTRLVQNEAYPSIAEDYAATFQVLKKLECDIFVAQHGGMFGLVEKAARLRASPKSKPFNDPEGYRKAVAAAEAAFRAELLRQQQEANVWPQFRGRQGLGVAQGAAPTEFGPDRNVVWKTAIPMGHSSPVIAGGRIFLTGEDGGRRSDAGREKVTTDGTLFTLALDRATGKELWRKELPRPRRERYQPTNSAASPSPVTDGNNIYVFYGDYGLISYRFDGAERWRLPLGPFNNVNGHGSSPILHGDKVYLICDQDTDSFLVAVDKDSGKVAWKVERPEVTRGYATPALYQPAGGPVELIVPGAYQLNSYDAETGKRLWWVRGQSWQPKSVPIINGDMIYAHSWEGGGEAEQPTETAPLTEILRQWDDDKDGFLSEKETRDPRWQRSYYTIDLNGNGKVNEHEWEFFRARRAARNSLVAIRGGGRGDITASHVVWSMQKFLPNVPSPLLYDGVLYLIKDGGVLSAVDPITGKILKQGRLTGALDTYYASPVAADGRIYFLSQQGKATVVKAGAEWEVLYSVEMDDETFATPAIVEGDLYLRTKSAIYRFRSR
ncbi:MAG: PQQ-binding-like beta-propeller repeat protein, partial [Bryobacteraceae bacterium]|nr:PQQ-binding-like beta-propeller repeat protein [Bryobacteraceae bacterium]